MTEIFKFPRLYTDQDIRAEADITLSEEQAHYLRSVLRKNTGDNVRVFNGRDGEWLCEITELGKKSGELKPNKQIKEQTRTPPKLHLLFAPIKKNRMDFLIEKAVELGVSDLHPIITVRTENRRINEERIKAQIIEAAEQCERLDIPALHPCQTLPQTLQSWPESLQLFWAAERLESIKNLNECDSPQAFLIGPEGGFDEKEIQTLQNQPFICPISLGDDILRAETAALFCLSRAKTDNDVKN